MVASGKPVEAIDLTVKEIDHSAKPGSDADAGHNPSHRIPVTIKEHDLVQSGETAKHRNLELSTDQIR